MRNNLLSNHLYLINLDYSSSLASHNVFWYMLWIYFSKKMGKKIEDFTGNGFIQLLVYTIPIFLKIANVKICKLLRIMSLFSLLSDTVAQIFTYASVDLLKNT